MDIYRELKYNQVIVPGTLHNDTGCNVVIYVAIIES